MKSIISLSKRCLFQAGHWNSIHTLPSNLSFLAILIDALDVLVLGLVPIAVIGKVYQNISPNGASIANVVELSQGASQLSFFPLLGKFGDSMARLRVEASSEVLSPSRLSLTFKSAGFEPITLFGMEVEKQLSLPKVREGGREESEGREGGAVGGGTKVRAKDMLKSQVVAT